MASVKLSKIPKHIWWGVFLPLVLVGLGIWRFWPYIEEYRAEDEREASDSLTLIAGEAFGSWGFGFHGGGNPHYWTGDVAGYHLSNP